MSTLRTATLCTLLVLLPVIALADDDQTCSDRALAILGRPLGVGSKHDSDEATFTAAACKLAPWDKNTLIAAVAYGKPVEDDDGSKTLLIATINLATGRIMQKELTPNVEEDSLTQYGDKSFRIDTAPYQLAPGVRAFGVRFSSTARGPSCPDNVFWDELTLYVPRNKDLVPVLTANMSTQQASSGCVGAATGHDVWDVATLSLSVEKTRSHGYADLRFTARIEPGTNMDPPPKDFSDKKSTDSLVVHFNGKEYPIADYGDGPKWWLVK